jgi:hypothetical protein
MLLPCSHSIAEYLEHSRPIPLGAIHPFWRSHLDKEPENYNPLLEPPVASQRKRKGTYIKKDGMDKRTPSGFELAEGKSAGPIVKKASSKCSVCGQRDHNARVCRER